MKTIFALLVVVAFTCNVNADNEYLQYEYDAAGNRIGRTVVQSQPNQAPKRNLLTADITVFPTITSDNVTISIALDAAGPSDHDYHRVEQDANIRAFKYFLKNEPTFSPDNWYFGSNPIKDYNKELPYDHPDNQLALKNGSISLGWSDFLYGPSFLMPVIINVLSLKQ